MIYFFGLSGLGAIGRIKAELAGNGSGVDGIDGF